MLLAVSQVNVWATLDRYQGWECHRYAFPMHQTVSEAMNLSLLSRRESTSHQLGTVI